MTKAKIRTEVFRRLEENSVSPDFWTADDIDESVNDGYGEIADASEFYERVAIINLLDHRAYYDLRTNLGSDTFLSPGRLLNTQTQRWMQPSHVRDLDYHTYRRWEAIATGQAERLFQRGLFWMGFFPQSGSDSGTVRFFYTAIPPPLVNDSDVPAFPQEFHYALVEYALGDLLGQEAETKKALAQWQQYQAGERALSGYTDKRIGVDRINALNG